MAIATCVVVGGQGRVMYYRSAYEDRGTCPYAQTVLNAIIYTQRKIVI